mgnify:CR=1 FL=1
MPKPDGILSLSHIKGVFLSPKHRHIMTDQLKRLYSGEFLNDLNDEHLYQLFEEVIELPGLSHIGYQKPKKPEEAA